MMQDKVLLAIIALLLGSPTLWAGGWPQPKNGGFFKLSEWWVVSDQHFTDVGRIDPNTTTGVFTTSFYGEYGFTDRLTGIAYFPFFSRTYFNNTRSATTGELLVEGEAINTVGDTDLGIRYGLIVDKPVVLSASLFLGLHLGEDSGGTAGNLQTGDGEFNQLLRLDVGTSFRIGRADAYATAYAGFNHRTQGFSEELRYGLEGGLNLFDGKLLTILRLYGIKSLKNGELGNAITGTSLFVNNSEHLTFAPEVAYRLNDRWGISAGFGTALYGQLIFASTSFTAGVFYQFP